MTLARFRADPARVRVAVRECLDQVGYVVEVHAREHRIPTFTAWAADPIRAVACAVTRAAMARLPGIDLGMEWTYEHPHGSSPVDVLAYVQADAWPGPGYDS